MLKQAAVQPRPKEYPQKSAELTAFPVKTDIDTSKNIAEKQQFVNAQFFTAK